MTKRRWRRIWPRGGDPASDVRDEFEFHLAERHDALIARGMSEQDARAAARDRFGDIDGAAATCAGIDARMTKRIRWRERIETVGQDVSYALRAMRRSPGFAIAAVVTIALGIGANTAVFSLLNALVIKPLDAANPRELVRIYTSEGRAVQNASDRFGGSSYADYVDLRQAKSLAGAAAFMPVAATIQLDRGPVRFQGRMVSENYFSVLGRSPFIGGWSASQAGDNDAVVSHRLWKSELGGSSDVIGRSMLVNGTLLRVVGVTAPAFTGIETSTVDLYVSFRAAPSFFGSRGVEFDRGARSVRLVGRLAPGSTAGAAELELDAIMKRLAIEFPASNAKRQVSVRPARSIIPMELAARSAVPIAALVFSATVVMLAVAGVNVAAVFMARTIRRRRELSIRLSLGAGRARLIRQLVTETVVLAFVATGIVLGLLSLLPLLMGALGAPATVQPHIDVTVLLYAAAVAIISGLFFGLAPAFVGVRSNVVATLRNGELGARPARARAQRTLVAAQLALSMPLLIVGAALLATLDEQQRIDPGFATANLVVALFEDPSGIDRDHERTFTRQVSQRLSALPGVASITTTSMAPLNSDGARSTIHIPGYAEGVDENMEVPMVTAGPGFLRTLGIALRRGRELSWADPDTLSRVIVNESMARKYWPAKDPVGSFVRLGGSGGAPAEVIGVMADTRFYALDRAPEPMYVVQRTVSGGSTLMIRSRGDASNLFATVRGAMSGGDVPLVLVQMRTMEDVLHSSLVVTRAVTAVLVCGGVLAILLASVGLYGVVSYVSTGRTREFGVRIALGASPASITRLVLRYGLRLAVIGGVIGMPIGVMALRLLGDLASGATNIVPLVSAVGGILAIVTLVACAVPAIRAARSSPAHALRAD